jgi:hypothetical protein
MDRANDPPRRTPSPGAPGEKRRASPLIFLIVLGGVGLFLLLLGPMMKPRPAPTRSLAATAPKTGPVQPSWRRATPGGGAVDAGAR